MIFGQVKKFLLQKIWKTLPKDVSLREASPKLAVEILQKYKSAENATVSVRCNMKISKLPV